MPGICVLCKNLEKKSFAVDDKVYEGCHCSQGKYDVNSIQGFYSLTVVLKQGKTIKDIQEKCDTWDDSLKAKA